MTNPKQEARQDKQETINKSQQQTTNNNRKQQQATNNQWQEDPQKPQQSPNKNKQHTTKQRTTTVANWTKQTKRKKTDSTIASDQQKQEQHPLPQHKWDFLDSVHKASASASNITEHNCRMRGSPNAASTIRIRLGFCKNWTCFFQSTVQGHESRRPLLQNAAKSQGKRPEQGKTMSHKFC